MNKALHPHPHKIRVFQV